MKKITHILIITALLFVLTSCENNSPAYHKVTFDSNGGTGTVSEKYVKDGDSVEEPKSPTKSGAVFSSWTLDGSVYDFSTPVKNDITLKAAYNTVYTVNFNSDGGNYTPEVQHIKENNSVEEPKSPTKSGAVFSSWTLDGSVYDFSTPVKNDITLKAAYTPLYTVTFDSDGGTYTPEVQYVKEGEKVIEPKSPDKSSTRGFMWWVNENNEPYDFSKPVKASITLKAVYWPANVLNPSGDPSSYDKEINGIYHETKCLYNIITNFVSLESMMKGEKNVATIFGVEDKGKAEDKIRTIVSNAKMNEGYITIKGETVALSDTGTDIYLSEEKYKTIGSNNSETKTYTSAGVTVTKYIIDISNLAFSTNFYKSDGSVNEIIETTISLKGTVIKYDTHMEFHVQFTIDGKEYPVLHAKTFNTTGGSEEITVNYRGYTGFFYTKTN